VIKFLPRNYDHKNVIIIFPLFFDHTFVILLQIAKNDHKYSAGSFRLFYRIAFIIYHSSFEAIDTTANITNPSSA
jgi:hypothetical protein